MMTIRRFTGSSRGRARAVAHGGLVYAVVTDHSSAADVAGQTRRALSELDTVLDEAGSDRSRIVQATVYLRDMAKKAEMDAVWCDWIGDEANWPQRACVGADLAGSDLVEIVVTAALA